MSVEEKHRTLLFADDLETSRLILRGCRVAALEGGQDFIVPGHTCDDDGPATGHRMTGPIGRLGQGRAWDGKGDPSLKRALEALIFPHLDKTHTVVTWDGQNFEAFCTEWENQHSPLVAMSPRPEPTVVVDSFGQVVGYYLKKVSTNYLFATDDGEIFYMSYMLSDPTYTVNTKKIAGDKIFFTPADQPVYTVGKIGGYKSWMKIEKWADLLVDIDGFVVAIHTYGDSDSSVAKKYNTAVDSVPLLGWLAPRLPDPNIPDKCFGEFDEDMVGYDECADKMISFHVDSLVLFVDVLSVGTSKFARKLLSVAKNAALRTTRSTTLALTLHLRAPRVAVSGAAGQAAKAGAAAAAGGKKAKLLLAAEKSGKKSNFMKVDLGQKTGMTHMAIRDVRAKITKHGVRVRFRPAGTARKLRKHGAVPKWEELKMKTINDDDILLGAPKSGKSQPGYFKPKLPDPKLKQADPARYEQVMKRYKQRDEEFRELAEKVKKYEKDGDIVVQDGVVKDGATGKDIAGDYDIFEILDKNGKRITDADPRYNKIVDDLRGRRIGAQHGAHVEWKPKDSFEIKIKEEIIERHRTKEPLFEFREDGSVWETFAD
jgi:hypothetical protein